MPTDKLQDAMPVTVPKITQVDAPLGKKIMRGVTFGALRYVLLAPIPLVMTPLILHKIGAAGYGTWAVFLAINSLTSLADLGLVGTLSKFVAEYHTHRDFGGLSRLLSSALAIFLGMLAIIAALLVGGTHLIIRLLLRGSSVNSAELVFLLRCFAVVVAANILVLLFSSVTTGLQRLDLTYLLSAANILLSAFVGGVLLLRGWGLRGLVYGYVAAALLTAITYAVVVWRLLPKVSWNPLRFDRAEARKMIGFSLRLYVIQASVAIHNQIEKFFLAVMIGVAPVGWFDIASDVALKIRSVIGLFLGPILPAASELHALRDTERTKELYYRTQKYLALLGVPIVACVMAFATRFVELWLGPGMSRIAVPMSILVAVNFVNLASGPAFLIFAGRGHLKPAIRSSLVGIVLDVVLSLGLIYKYGFAGAAMGTSFSLLLAAGYLIWIFHRESGYSFGRLLRESYLKPTLCSFFAITVLLTLHPANNLSWSGLIEMTVMFGTFYSILILISRFFDEYDWSKIEGLLPAARFARRASWNV